jgi:hypothetical protein
MFMKELTRFKRWADDNRKGRGLLCHFYDAESTKQKQYYTKSDYAYFNLFCSSPEWMVKGTTDHGIRSQREKTSQVPCLNCYQIDEEFYEAIETHCNEAIKKYELGIILNKRILKNHLGEDNVKDVELWDHRDSRPSPQDCWQYDIATARRKLWPFNSCQVVRVRIPRFSLYNITIKGLPRNAIMGLLVKNEGYHEKAMAKLLKKKKWEKMEVFPML